nr:HAMP domain-containing sensor histidine kinase [Maliibacterium massiliense]
MVGMAMILAGVLLAACVVLGVCLQRAKARIARLCRQQERMDMLLSCVAHEMRSPVTLISNTCALIQCKYADQVCAGLGTYLRMMRYHATRLNYLCTNVLDNARAKHDALQMQLVQTDLCATLKNVCDNIRLSAGCDEISLDFTSDAPACSMQCDAFAIERVADNLITNACKAVGRGGSVSVHLTRDASYAIFSVRDTGCGMTQAELDSIFEPFVQRPKTQEQKRHSTGLGLALVKMLVEAHGGVILVESKPGEGTCFTVKLPLVPALRRIGEMAMPSAQPIDHTRVSMARGMVFGKAR